MFLDGLLYNNVRLRHMLSRLVPDSETTISLLSRTFSISTREEIGLLRLAWLVNSSPTGHELGSLFSLAGFVRNGTFVDVGANVGLYSVPMASLAQVSGFNVIAIEPNPKTATRLRKNLAKYACATVIEAAASNCERTIDMVTTISSVTFHIQKAGEHQRYSRTGAVPVKLFRLDTLPQLLESSRLVLKIDVEGHESEVLEGMAGLFDNQQVSAMMIDGFADQRIPAQLVKMGFKLYDSRSLEPFNPDTHFSLLAVAKTD